MNLPLITVMLFLLCLFYLLFGIYILLKLPTSLKNRMFFTLCLHLGAWSLGYALMSTAPSMEQANRWREFASLGWCFFYAIWLDYAILVQNGDKKDWMTDVRRLILYLPSFFFLFKGFQYPAQEVLENVQNIWRDTYSVDGIALLFGFYSMLYTFAGVILIYRWGKRSALNREKKQAKIITVAVGLNFILGFFVKFVLSRLTENLFPIDILLFTVFISGVYHAMSKYQLMSISATNANDFVFDHIGDPVILLGNDMLIKEVNRAAVEMTGYQDKDLVGRPLNSLISELKLGQKSLDTLIQNGYVRASEVKLLTKNNVIVPCLFSGGTIDNQFGDSLGMACILHDITDRKRVENLLLEKKRELEIIVEERTRRLKQINQQLAEEIQQRRKAEKNELSIEERFRTLMMQSSEGILIIEPESREFLECNNAAQEILSVKDRKLSTMFDYLRNAEGYSEFTLFLTDALNQNQKQQNKLVSIHSGAGGERKLELLATRAEFIEKAYIMVIIRDITDQLMMTERRQQIARMESIGTLSGGIAHDFNNILSGIMGYTLLTIEELPETSQQTGNLLEVMRLGERAKNVIAQILTFSRNAMLQKEKIDLGSIAEEVVKMLHLTLPSGIKIIYRKPAYPCPVYADAGEMHQLIMNLCVNAKLAFEDKGGIVQVSLSELEIDPESTVSYGLGKPGPYVKLEVRDNGCGMDEEVKQRIFEPFFTKRGSNTGTGLGLSVVHGIVNRMEGTVKVESELGQGSTFTILLPWYFGADVESPGVPAPNFLQDKVRILFVDDEESIVATSIKLLHRRGYEVTGAANANEALDLFTAQPDSYDILISDQSMPELTGEELLEELRKLRPELPAILCSGFLQTAEGSTSDRTVFLPKPVAVSDYCLIIDQLCGCSNERNKFN